jgi:gamma-glutamyl hercynylcysteine S-oxide synthase
LHTVNLTAHQTAAQRPSFRGLNAQGLASALRQSRADTLATFACFEAALARCDLAVPYAAELNPPLWELGHVGWFQTFWLARNPARPLGAAAKPNAPQRSGFEAIDALYDSSNVEHASRWGLPCPDANATRAALAAGLEETLALLMQADENDDALYFYRLCLAHEDMHHEAALYTAQRLGLPVADARWRPHPLPPPGPELPLPGTGVNLGGAPTTGFVFDNECGVCQVQVERCRVDNQVVRWAEFLPFVEAGGYTNPHWWPGPAGDWLGAAAHQQPRALRRHNGAWQRQIYGQWQALDTTTPACHLNSYEAQAWCLWAGRRLPTEAEWFYAATLHPQTFAWGSVWEWTASPFEPFSGFKAHPYADYSAPWFGNHRVLRGASFATQARMHSPRYRNFYLPHRNDMFAGFRSCAL